MIGGRDIIPLIIIISLILGGGYGIYYLVSGGSGSTNNSSSRPQIQPETQREATTRIGGSITNAPQEGIKIVNNPNVGKISNPIEEMEGEIIEGRVSNVVTRNVPKFRIDGYLDEIKRNYRPSPYAGFVTFLNSTSPFGSSTPEREFFVLDISEKLASSIPITGWKVVDRIRQVSYKFPKGQNLFYPNAKLTSDNLKVRAGDRVIVSSSVSPVGTSFRVNKCTGYRSQFKNFVPTIKTDCQDPVDELVKDATVPFDDFICYEEVSDLKNCSAFSKIPTGVTNQCEVFIENVLTESGCAERHRNDADFLQKELRVYLSSPTSLWSKENNALYLLDENDLLIATLIY